MEREEKRLEQFRLLRKEIRGSQQYLVVGIDISKDTHNAFMRTTTGKTLYRRLVFTRLREGFDTLIVAGRSGTSGSRVCRKWFSAWNPRRIITSHWENS